nr:hypothetical protein CFP56_41692 [Quercus suber]
MEPTITRGLNSLNCVREEKDMDSCMQNNSSPVSQGQQGKTDETKEMPLCATLGYGESSCVAVTVDIALPSASSEIGEKLPLKKRKLYHQWEAKAEDKNIAVEEKNITVQVAVENETPEVAEENAIDVNDKDGMVEVKMVATEMLDVDWQGNNIINCVVNYESVPPSPPFYSPQRQEKQEQITFDEKFVEPLEKPRRGRKGKQGNYQSADDNRPVQYKQNQKLKRGRSKRWQDDYFYWTDWYVEKQKQQRGRPRKVTEQSLKENNWNEEKPKEGKAGEE